MNDLPIRVHEEWDGYVMQHDDGMYNVWEYAVKVPNGHGKIIIADIWKGQYKTLEEAKKHIK